MGVTALAVTSEATSDNAALPHPHVSYILMCLQDGRVGENHWGCGAPRPTPHGRDG